MSSRRAAGAEPRSRRSSSGPLVAVVGRTNVGKSTLVNRLIGRREAIEHDMPGVTRDRQSYAADWSGRSFRLVDTGGWEPRARGLAAKVVEQAERAAKEAAVILFVVDAETGATSDDVIVARTLRRSQVPVMLVANKVDSLAAEAELATLERLGFGQPFPVSALHGRGSGDLLDAVLATLGDEPDVKEDAEGLLRVAIVGRPNAGKSSLFNRLIGEDRSIVDPIPGTTRDAVDEYVVIGGRQYEFVDTAGMRKRAKQSSGPEYYGLVRSLRAIDRCDVAVIVIDAAQGVTDQDQRIGQRVQESGRAAVLVLNKWDLLDEYQREVIERDVEEQLPFLRWAPIVRTSALTKRGVMRVMPAVEEIRMSWEKRIATASLNGWLRTAIERIPLGSRGVRPPRIRYATQAGIRPPHFVFFASARIPEHAIRALENSLRASFGFEGTPIRVSVRVRSRDR